MAEKWGEKEEDRVSSEDEDALDLSDSKEVPKKKRSYRCTVSCFLY